MNPRETDTPTLRVFAVLEERHRHQLREHAVLTEQHLAVLRNEIEVAYGMLGRLRERVERLERAEDDPQEAEPPP